MGSHRKGKTERIGLTRPVVPVRESTLARIHPKDRSLIRLNGGCLSKANVEKSGIPVVNHISMYYFVEKFSQKLRG
jgi:hypothetical protein